MAKKYVTICDWCQADVGDYPSFFVQTGWQADAAGGPSERSGRDFDLCDKCVRKALGILIGDIKSFKEAESFLVSLFKKVGG